MSTVKERQAKLIICVAIFWVLCLTAYMFDMIVAITAGQYGADAATMSLGKLTISLKVFFASEWFFVTGAAAFRLGILLLYIEVFRVDWFYWSSIIIGTIVTLYWVASILTITLLCRPINSNWNIMVTGTCGDVGKTEYASAGFNLIIDFLVVALPMPTVWTLNMPKEKRVSITAAFLLGLITVGINIGRIMQTKLCDQDDTTFCALDASILVAAEISSGIIVSCAPMMGAVLWRNSVSKGARPDPQIRTFGSSERTWPKRHLLRDTELLQTQDDDLELAKSDVSCYTQIAAPEDVYSPLPNQTSRSGLYPQGSGIMVCNELSVHEATHPQGEY
ncbi:uncharacterized protein N7483_013149 [Penicillium malachiteum]|uniref:uncharacterized protein n=1 Tax=Penicillium malachiteum TaxID=1324776 RepID=UPI002546852D|nr:uncharacterized protein N7483_013149 [Penicillium malachiteum]KAJ5715968.1 hypothetical protein N7483_013149 [Penicillium malachiteum]